MSIASSDLKYKLSITSGSAGNSATQPDPNASLGKYISTTEITDATLNNLFDDISGDENAASTVDYRCLFIHNSHGSLTLTSPKVWISAEVSGGAAIAIGIDTTAQSLIGSASAQALTVANETTAPVGVSFSSPTSKAAGLSLGDLPAGRCRAVWVRRTSSNTSPVDADGATLSVSGDTSA